MSIPDHKPAIRAAFSRSALAYDGVASVQRLLASNLMQGIHPCPHSQVLDVGCGTGYVSRLLLEKNETLRLIALDHAYGMCAYSKMPNVICADMEFLPLQAGVVDLYCSSLAWQWASPFQAAAEAARVMRKNGMLAVATLGPATLHELRQVFDGIDQYQHVLEFRSVDIYRQSLEKAGFVDIRINNQNLKAYEPDLHSVIMGIRTLGAGELTTKRRPGMIGRGTWQRIQASYEEFREAKGLPLSYDAIYLYARKPE